MEKTKLLDYPIERPLTLRERIVTFVKDSIINGRLKPGERVPEHEIAESFGISRTPIREAFRQLESEGFITVIPRKGAVVSPITAKDVSEFYSIKSLLEGYAAGLACAKFTEKELKRLTQINQQMQKCAAKNDVRSFYRLDNQFHEVFLSSCGNDKLCELAHQIAQQFERFRIMALSMPGRMKTSIKQHEDIIKAFTERKADVVEKLVRANAEFSAEILVTELSRGKGR
ncbi:Transcriptional regulator, GntR family [hydrothermal vent metagenome]|uniref:Transcriptional regulator, GntR family n=1 Tax=hydrothermal vent metagenome TaxID=652676 RepID=A0A3B0QSP3_9ZZZZ